MNENNVFVQKLQQIKTNRFLVPEGVEPPKDELFERMHDLLDLLIRINFLPTKIVASAEGGLVALFCTQEKYADIEFFNNDKILGVLANSNGNKIFDVSLEKLDQAVDIIYEYIINNRGL